MKLRVTAGACIAAAIVAAGMWDLQRTSAQVEVSQPPAPQPVAPADVLISTSSQPYVEAPLPAPQPRVFEFRSTDEGPLNLKNSDPQLFPIKANFAKRHATDTLRQAAAALRDAKDEGAKTAAQGQLLELLNKVFEDDMHRREEELHQVEERTRNLRALMDRRREKKDEIVDLQIKVLLNEADGLGFFNEARTPELRLPVGWTRNSDNLIVEPQQKYVQPPSSLPPK